MAKEFTVKVVSTECRGQQGFIGQYLAWALSQPAPGAKKWITTSLDESRRVRFSSQAAAEATIARLTSWKYGFEVCPAGGYDELPWPHKAPQSKSGSQSGPKPTQMMILVNGHWVRLGPEDVEYITEYSHSRLGGLARFPAFKFESSGDGFYRISDGGEWSFEALNVTGIWEQVRDEVFKRRGTEFKRESHEFDPAGSNSKQIKCPGCPEGHIATLTTARFVNGAGSTTETNSGGIAMSIYVNNYIDLNIPLRAWPFDADRGIRLCTGCKEGVTNLMYCCRVNEEERCDLCGVEYRFDIEAERRYRLRREMLLARLAMNSCRGFAPWSPVPCEAIDGRNSPNYGEVKL